LNATFAIDDADFAAAVPSTPHPRIVSRKAQRAEAQAGTSQSGARSDEPQVRADTESSFDVLTDLFLGEVDRSSRQRPTGVAGSFVSASREEMPKSTSEIVPPPSRPVLRLRKDESDAELMQAEPASPSPVASQVLPFIEDASVRTPVRERALSEPVIECVVLGNLPVLASAWASQYVREIAGACGKPVAYVRVQAGFASVELVGQWANESPVTVERHDSIDAALAFARAETDRWVIRVDAGQIGSLVERPLVRVLTLLTGSDEAARVAAYAMIRSVGPALKPLVDTGPMVRLAIMGSGEDGAHSTGRVLAEAANKELGRNVAYVACSARIGSSRAPSMLYSGPVNSDVLGVIESIEAAAGVSIPTATFTPAPQSIETAAPVPIISTLAASIEGVASDVADDVSGADFEIVSTTDDQAVEPEVIATEVESVVEASSEKREAVAVEPAIETASPAMALSISSAVVGPTVHTSVITSLEDPTPVPQAQPPASSISLVQQSASINPTRPAPNEPSREFVGAARTLVPQMEFPIAEHASIHSSPAPQAVRMETVEAPASTFHTSITPTTTRPSVPATPAHTDAPDITSHIRGLSRLAWTCPYAKGVTIASDVSGRLHMLMQAHGGDTQASIASLMIASSWARSHAQLIAQAIGASALDDEPVLHIFTDQPKDAVRLIDSGLRVHVLAPVNVGDRTAWFCTELN
jgi:hypothetical protein